MEQKLVNWEAEPRQPAIDFKAMANKLQNALAKSYVDIQELEGNIDILDKHITLQNYQLSIKQKRVEDLEFLLAGAIRDGDSKLEKCNEDSAV